jgi:uncharacterized protein YkwD
MNTFSLVTQTVAYRTAFAVTVALALLASPSAAVAAAGCADSDTVAEQATKAQLESATLCLVNEERTSRGLEPVRPQRRLATAAMQHADDMVETPMFSHVGSDGSNAADRIKKTGYLRHAKKWSVGENIAYGYGDLSSPREIMNALMNSPEHRANILDKALTDIGIGIRSGTPDRRSRGQGATYTTEFGSRR